MTTETPELLNVPECAALLRTSPKAIYTLVERGQLRGVLRVGRRVLFDRARLLAGLERGGAR